MELYCSSIMNLEEVMDKTKSCVAVCDKNFVIVAVNKVFSGFYGLDPHDLIGKTAIELYPEFKNSVFYECCNQTLKTDKETTRVGYSNILKGWFATRATKYDDNYYVLFAHEISHNMNCVGFVPLHDTITSLYNRHKFEDDFIFNLNNQNSFGLFIVDILKLKKINELYGIDQIDLILMKIAGKLKLNIYKENIVEIYKISADKFAIISKTDKQSCLMLTDKIKEVFSFNYKESDEFFSLSIAIGFKYVSNSTKNHFEIFQEVECALGIAKQKQEIFYEHDENNQLQNKKELLKEIKNAFKEKEFILYYQPQIDLINKKVCGIEALIRWNHKEKGILTPNYFLQLIEEFELTEVLDKYVINKAMQDSNFFVSEKINLPISINLSTSSLSNQSILDYFDNEITRLNVNRKLLTIEITESSLIENIELSKKIINRFATQDIKIAIDDFGSGYSSFGYLVRYPTDYLKIDREFIQDIHTKKNLKQIVSNLIKMAHSLNILVIAEGVELQEEADLLKKIGCDIIQGYFYGKPMTKDNLLEKVKSEGISLMKSIF